MGVGCGAVRCVAFPVRCGFRRQAGRQIILASATRKSGFGSGGGEVVMVCSDDDAMDGMGGWVGNLMGDRREFLFYGGIHLVSLASHFRESARPGGVTINGSHAGLGAG